MMTLLDFSFEPNSVDPIFVAQSSQEVSDVSQNIFEHLHSVSVSVCDP